MNSPFLGLGIESERAELLKKVNDRHVKVVKLNRLCV